MADDDPDEVRPLVAGTVRWDGRAAVVELGRSEVRIEGDVDIVGPVLGACDGRSTVAQLAQRYGSDARSLVALLLSRGAVVDAEEAWRVLHRQSSVGSALGRPIDDDELAAVGRATFAPQPSADRTVALAPVATNVGELAARRRSSTPRDLPVPATFATVSTLLATTYSVTSSHDGPSRGTVPSAGALYPLVVHVLLREPLAPAEPGLWWHDPYARRLHRIGDAPADVEALFVPEPACAALLTRRQPIVFLSADLRRTSRKYGARGYRYALLEAGSALQAAYLAATELGVPLRAIGGIDDGNVHRCLRLPETAVGLLALLVGS